MKEILVGLFILFTTTITPSVHGQELIDPVLIKADIDTLISGLKDCHPTFSTYYEENDIQRKIENIKRAVNAPMSSLDLFRIMQPIISIDGHTSLSYRGEIGPMAENPFFPLRTIIYDKVMYVKDNLSGNASIRKGSVIEKINDVPVNRILDTLVRYIPGEKSQYKIKILEEQFHRFYRLVFGSFSEFKIQVEGTLYTADGVDMKAFQEPDRPGFELRFYDDDIAYIYKRSFSPPEDFINFTDSAFRVINDKQIKYLIIDNLQGGGLTDLADTLMSYFTDQPYSVFDKKMTKISPMTSDFIKQKIAGGEGYVQGDYFIQEYKPHQSPRPRLFKGKTYILTGPLSYSAGTCFAAAARCYESATIVGEETGQPLLSNGDLNRFILPNTNLMCFTSLSRVYMPCNHNNTSSGVVPDYKVTPTLEDLLSDEDHTLDYTLELIRKEKQGLK